MSASFELGEQLGFWTLAPFACMLLAIAIFPLVFCRWFELLQAHYPSWFKVMVRTFSYFLGFACCMFVAYRGWFMLDKLWTTKDAAAGTWKFPLWPFEAALVAGIFFMGWGFVTTGIRDLINFKHQRGPYAPAVKKPKAKPAVPSAPE